MGDAMGEEKQSNPKYYNYFNALQAFCGGDEVRISVIPYMAYNAHITVIYMAIY
jgi:hypothetical protein